MNAMSSFSCAARLRHRHDFQQVAVRILEIETAPATTGVDLTVGGLVGLAAVGDAPALDPAEDGLELCFAHVEGVVTRARVRLVGEIQGQALVDADLREVAPAR